MYGILRMGNPSPRNRIVKHYLMTWAYLDQNFEYLTDSEELRMKILYASLRTLDKEEVQFLADKYRVKRKPYKKDEQLASEYGIDFKEYRNERIRIEDKLRPAILENIEKYKKEMDEALRIEYSK